MARTSLTSSSLTTKHQSAILPLNSALTSLCPGALPFSFAGLPSFFCLLAISLAPSPFEVCADRTARSLTSSSICDERIEW